MLQKKKIKYGYRACSHRSVILAHGEAHPKAGFVSVDKLKLTVSGTNDRDNGAEQFVLCTGTGGDS